MNKITVQTNINAPIGIVWKCWTEPSHIIKWNFASDDWHCPNADINLIVGGVFNYEMAAKDGSFSFNFWGTYNKIELENLLEIELGDGRKMDVAFESINDTTTVTETFDPESENSLDLQKTGWQLILDNFKKHVEGLSK